jgi:hypothetical protein
MLHDNYYCSFIAFYSLEFLFIFSQLQVKICVALTSQTTGNSFVQT